MSKYSGEDILIDMALKAATAATAKYLTDNPDQWYPCGFASVRIRPARGRLISALQARSIGRTDDFNGGYLIYNPSGNCTQCMDAKEAGARAFVAVIKTGFPDLNIYSITQID